MPMQGYFPGSPFDAGVAAGRGFLSGLDTPKLIRKNLIPLRSDSITLMVSRASRPLQNTGSRLRALPLR